ncbi:ABC transporter permease [Microbacter margulisiae]|uniref:ABC-type multidrug transport system permease subunit n=1 Tax=Microbacter margulisiae TaxID=1350067 RepID=A0A7W5DPF5_9PORP|nr:ABC transporter permease [Microbacter margulisiae]MBB3186144.1 ABC-type multidrug transport system permease subunit [Microbacter margulisiae]
MKKWDNNQLYQLIKTQFLETIREPSVLFWGIGFPILISIGLGLAFTRSSNTQFHVNVVTSDTHFINSFIAPYSVKNIHDQAVTYSWSVSDSTLGNTTYIFRESSWKDAIVALKRGEANLILTDSAGTPYFHFDPHDTQAQLLYMKLSALFRHPVVKINDKQSHIQPLTLKGVRYIDFLIPGLIALGILNALMWGISYNIIERRSQKLLRRMVATPMRKSNFLMAIIFVRIVMNIIEAGILFLFAWLFFGITIQGNIGALFLLFFAGNIAFAGIAVLLSSRTEKTEIGTGWINAITMPMMILSGIFFSYHNFPDWSIGFIKLLPLTVLTDGIRSIFNEGASWLQIIFPSFLLSALGVICFLLGLKRFKWF